MVLFTPNVIIFFDTAGEVMLRPVKDAHRCVELCICPLRTAALRKGPSLRRDLWAVGWLAGFWVCIPGLYLTDVRLPY